MTKMGYVKMHVAKNIVGLGIHLFSKTMKVLKSVAFCGR